MITPNTLPLVITKNLKYLPPYGWNDTIHSAGFFEQCHIIAYSLSAKFCNRRNMFIGTEYLNTSLMGSLEKKVKTQVEKYNDRILYRVTIKYKGIDLIPIAVLIEAQSLDKDFHLCEFCYNIQPNVLFHYKDGTIVNDNRKDSQINSDKKNQSLNTKISDFNIDEETKPKRVGKWKDYIINRKTNIYHLRNEVNNCSDIINVNPKYLIETTTKEETLLDIELNRCKECN